MRILILLLSALVLVACSKLNESNYARLKTGMSVDEVDAIIGSADRCDEALSFRFCEWGNEEQYIRVKFIAGKVVALSKQGLR